MAIKIRLLNPFPSKNQDESVVKSQVKEGKRKFIPIDSGDTKALTMDEIEEIRKKREKFKKDKEKDGKSSSDKRESRKSDRKSKKKEEKEEGEVRIKILKWLRFSVSEFSI